MSDGLDVIIVGAPRSGTNVLRDVVASFDQAATWPCDEINLVWRHGNRDEPSDELTAEMARSDVRTYVRRQFAGIRRRYAAPVVIEKTCATSLRPEFARAVLPNAKYLFITRDGVDAAASAMDRWHAPLDLRYTAAKARFVPASDLPYYGVRFLGRQTRRRGATAATNVATWWGPKPRDYRQLLATRPLDEICAIQWQRCVEASRRGLAGLGPDRLLHLSYEAFVHDPATHVERVRDFLGLTGPLPDLVESVSPSSVGKGRSALGPEVVARLEALVGPTLAELGYGG